MSEQPHLLLRLARRLCKLQSPVKPAQGTHHHLGQCAHAPAIPLLPMQAILLTVVAQGIPAQPPAAPINGVKATCAHSPPQIASFIFMFEMEESPGLPHDTLLVTQFPCPPQPEVPTTNLEDTFVEFGQKEPTEQMRKLAPIRPYSRSRTTTNLV